MPVIDTIYPYTSLEGSFTVLLQKLLQMGCGEIISTCCHTAAKKEFAVLRFK
jgi:hypothetical protein